MTLTHAFRKFYSFRILSAAMMQALLFSLGPSSANVPSHRARPASSSVALSRAGGGGGGVVAAARSTSDPPNVAVVAFSSSRARARALARIAARRRTR